MSFGGASVVFSATGGILLGVLMRFLYTQSCKRRMMGVLQAEWPAKPAFRLHREPRPCPPGFPEPERRSPFVRDSRAVFLAYPERCDLIFWQPDQRPPLDERIINFFTGSSGLSAVAADCGWQISGHVYVATSWRGVSGANRVDGPHLSLRASPVAFARVALNEVLDPARFRTSLERQIADPQCRHKTAWDFGSYLRGTILADRVTCSGMIGRAVLEQPDSAFASALRRVPTHGEIAPADLMRATVGIKLRVEGCAITVVRTSAWERMLMRPIGTAWRDTR